MSLAWFSFKLLTVSMLVPCFQRMPKERVVYPNHQTESHKVWPRSLLIYLRSNVLQESKGNVPKCHQDGQRVLSGVVQKACSGCWWNWVQGATYGMGEVPAMSFSEPWDPGFKSPELTTAACVVSGFRGFFFTFINVHVSQYVWRSEV